MNLSDNGENVAAECFWGKIVFTSRKAMTLLSWRHFVITLLLIELDLVIVEK